MPPEDEGTQTNGETNAGKMLPQEQVNSLLAEQKRALREQFKDYDDLKAKAQRLAEIEQANATELEKAIAKARDEGRAEVSQAANIRLVTAEARAIAAEAKFRNPGLAVKAVDLSDVKVTEDGSVDAAAIKARLEALASSEPYLIDEGKTPPPKPDPSQGSGGGGATSKADQGRAEAEKRFGPKAGASQ